MRTPKRDPSPRYIKKLWSSDPEADLDPEDLPDRRLIHRSRINLRPFPDLDREDDTP